MQKFKHLLLKRYLQAWFPILGRQVEKLLYVETHAGRGLHDTGDYGSPLVALQALRDHTAAKRVLLGCDVRFLLMEKDPSHAECLRTCLQEVIEKTDIEVDVEEGDFGVSLDRALTKLEASKDVPPAFVFVDPFNYNIPMTLLQRVLALPSCEVLVTFMAQDAVTAMRDAASGSEGKVQILDKLYGDIDWRSCLRSNDFGAQLDAALRLYEMSVGAKWCTQMRMHGNRKYALMHFTNNDRGREEMKRAMWKVGELVNRDGQYELHSTDDPDQAPLLRENPDLVPLELAFRKAFINQKLTRLSIDDWCRRTEYLDTHLNEVIRQGVDGGWILKHFKGPVGPSMGDISVKAVDQEALF